MLGKMSLLLVASWFQKIVDFVTGLLACIPQFIYFLYTCCASFLDFLQYLIRKLAGLDVYYINGEATDGDIVISFVKGVLGIDKSAQYSALTTVFWSLVIFGCILLVLTTIFSIIKAHYNYDSKKSHPMTIIGSSLKSLALMAIVPIVAVFGLYLSQIVLQTLDQITSNASASTTTSDGKTVDFSSSPEFSNVFQAGYSGTNVKDGQVSEDGEGSLSNKVKTYTSFDFFGNVAYTTTATFSGVMFKTAAYEANRVRIGSYTPSESSYNGGWSNYGVFFSSTSDMDERREEVANQIDYAFANALTVKDDKVTSLGIDGSESGPAMLGTFASPYSATLLIGLINVKVFSKYNVGLVWYYYNLWNFNFLLGFAGIAAFLIVLGNITFGMIKRLIQLLALFFVFPPLIGIAPLDGGAAFGKWRKQFLSDTLMAYGAVIGMNIFFLILPFLNTIQFFNVVILDNIMNIIIMLAGLTMISGLISMLSGFINATDANSAGKETREATTGLASKGFQATMGMASIGATAMGLAPVARGVKSVGRKAGTFVKTHFSLSARNARKDHKLGLKSEEEVFEEEKAAEEARLGRKLTDKELEAVKQKSHSAYEAQYQDPTKVSKEDREKHEKREENRQKRAEKWANIGNGVAKAANRVLIPFGAKLPEKGADGKRDWSQAKGNLKAFGNAVLDISKLGFSVVGGAIGLSGMKKGLDSRGDTDAIKSFFQAVVGDDGMKNPALSDSLKTQKQKDDEKKDKEKADSANMSSIVENTAQMTKAVSELATRIKEMK